MAVDLLPLIRSTEGDQVRLLGSRCTNCGTAAFPARPVCFTCLGRDNPEVELSGLGRIRSWTRVELPPAGFDEPIVVATIELEDGPVLFGLLVGPPTGATVEAVAHPVRDHAPGYAFRSVA